MKVTLPKAKLDYFRRKARSSPNEQLAFLLGHVTSDGVEIDLFIYPKLEISTPTSVQTSEETDAAVLEHAHSDGYEVVGSIHSHPGAPPVMSEADFGGHIVVGETVTGIVSVNDRKTYVCFWSRHSSLPCELIYA